MVFVTVGTYIGGFNRLLKVVDQLVDQGVLRDVRAQIGPSTYLPRYFVYERFLSAAQMHSHMEQCEFVVCHGGAATLNECLESRKKIIVMPRMSAFAEVPDDHQMELVQFLTENNRVLMAVDVQSLKDKVEQVHNWEPQFVQEINPNRIAQAIKEFIQKSTAD